MPNIGPTELIVVLVVMLLIFGPKRLPQAGRGLGEGLRGFKESLTGRSEPAAEVSAGVDAPEQAEARREELV
jgi:sec-independent protein translocase protein TatA